jgi:hypothetical protein
MGPSRGIWLGTLLALVSLAAGVRAQNVPTPQAPFPQAEKGERFTDLPRYDLNVVFDPARRLVIARETVTWTNTSPEPIGEIVFNAHAHYSIPDKDIGLLAKIAEVLRSSPKEILSFDGPALEVEDVQLVAQQSKAPSLPKLDNAGNPLENKPGERFPSPGRKEPPPPPPKAAKKSLGFHYAEGNTTALTTPLPAPLLPGEAVTLEVNFRFKVPAKKGRWGQWDGITTLVQWLPVVAVHDAKGWQPAPFIPWHMPFHNEAGVYRVRVLLPSDQKLAASAPVRRETEAKDGWKEIEFEEICVRDFALVSSARFQEWTGETAGVKIRVLAPPEHEFYARAFVETVEKALPVYNQWFGKYPYSQFTVAEGCLGWSGNQCGGLVVIDDRMFDMPHIAKNYPTYLLMHELSHQWWYNAVGTNGYAETWMDEGPATYFSHRLADRCMGPNNELIDYPQGLGWLPNIRRDDFRNFTMIGAWARGEAHPCVQDMPKYGHLVNLTSAAYDRGSKVIGMIEERLGERDFLLFTQQIYAKYQWRILHVADYQRELEAYTGHSWEEFFQNWVYGIGRCDWSIERVEINEEKASVFRLARSRGNEPVRVTIYLKQQGDYNEPTTLGIRLQPGSDYQIRVPIQPDVPVMQVESVHALVTCAPEQVGSKQHASVKVEITLPQEPEQISVDPDRILIDSRPTNNHWKREFRFHLTPFYTQLDEVDVTNSFDRWNLRAGPWFYFSSYDDPWYTRSEMVGWRVGVYRTQELSAAGYLAYRSNDRNIVAGADLIWDHALLPNMQFGVNVEKSLATLGNGDIPTSRAVAYARYVIMYGSSLYLPPFEYVEGFAVVQNRNLPDPIFATPGADLFRDQTAVGLHYHKNMMTPYWDAEGGYSFDGTYQYGLPIFGNQREFQQLYGQFAFVKSMAPLKNLWGEGPLRDWLSDTRWAFRVGGAAALPSNGQFFALGGGDNFRGFNLDERQGSLVWLGSVEWRVPIIVDRSWDFVDHVGSVRNVYLAPFYDVGNAYVNGHELGNIAHAVGAGLRVDVNWLGMIERTTLRFDIAKTVNGSYPLQFWFGVQHPF